MLITLILIRQKYYRIYNNIMEIISSLTILIALCFCISLSIPEELSIEEKSQRGKALVIFASSAIILILLIILLNSISNLE